MQVGVLAQCGSCTSYVVSTLSMVITGYPGLSSVWFGDWTLLNDYIQCYVYISVPTLMDMGIKKTKKSKKQLGGHETPGGSLRLGIEFVL